MTVALPAEYAWGFVTGKIIHARGDQAPDADRLPEASAATGSVKFTPLTRTRRASDALVIHEVVSCGIGPDGIITDAENQPGVWLFEGAYRVEFTLGGGGTYPAFDIAVTAAHTIAAPLDLATAAPYVPPTGTTATVMLMPSGAYADAVLGWGDDGLEWQPNPTTTIPTAVADYLIANPPSGSPDATALIKGIVRLAGDLGGTADAPTVPGLADKVANTDLRLTDARTPTAHTHTSAQITDWAEAVQDAVAAMLTSGTNVTLSYDDTAGTLSVTAAGGDAEVMRDTIGAALVGVNGVTVTANDALDTITISITGLTIAQVSGLQAALDGKAATGHTHSELHTHPAVIAQGATAAAARAAIGAGTSNLALGTTAGTAKAGDYEPDLSGLVPASRTVAGKALTGNITLAAADLTDFTEASQDVVGAMVAAAGGTYDDAGGSITLPAGGGGGSSAQVDIYYAVGAPGSQSSYTWIKPVGAKAVHVFMVGAGAGGGSGRRGAAGSLRAGGGAGSPGRHGQALLDASGLPASVAILVSKGGAGGTGVATDDTNGNKPAQPGGTSFGPYSFHTPGAGDGGTAAGLTNAGNASSFGWQSFYPGNIQGGYGGTGGGANPGDGQALQGGSLNPSGGGGGGGINASNVHTAGGLGGGDGGGAKGAAGGGNGGTGTPANTWIGVGGGGGGGNAAGAGGNGADGGYGAGGGGGGASVNGYVSGAGGNGGDGIVIITTYF